MGELLVVWLLVGMSELLAVPLLTLTTPSGGEHVAAHGDELPTTASSWRERGEIGEKRGESGEIGEKTRRENEVVIYFFEPYSNTS
jgi:hypothetical protein